MSKKSLLFVFSTLLFLACNSDKEQIFNVLNSKKTNITFVNQVIAQEDFNIIDYLYFFNGGGVAVGDINNDGLADIYLSSNMGENHLYLNLGNLQFKNIAKEAGVENIGAWKTGVAMVDINGDGWLDIYQCRLGDYKGVSGKNQLFINQGNGIFKEEAEKYHLDFKGFSTQATFFDLDNDGDLDVYLLNHAVHTPNSFGKGSLRNDFDTLSGDRLFRNDNLIFTDISKKAHIYQSQIGYGLGVGLGDFNNDFLPDIFVSNDFTENDYLYLSKNDTSFTERYSKMATHTSKFSMGNDIADFNNDGLLDIMTLDMLPEDERVRKSSMADEPYEIFNLKLAFDYMPQYSRNTLQLNNGNNTFSDIALMSKTFATDWSWACLFVDIDNDGWKDLFISNGIERRPNDADYINFLSANLMKNKNASDNQLYSKMPSGVVSNYFFQNNKDLTFIDKSSKWINAKPTITNGIAYADFDNDGDIDFVLNNYNNEAQLLENKLQQSDKKQNFLNIKLLGQDKNIHAIGTKIWVYHNNNLQYFEVYPVRGFQSSVDNRIHIGLGASNSVDSIKIRWNKNQVSQLYNVTANQFITIAQNESHQIANENNEITQPKIFEKISNSSLHINYKHIENKFIEFNREPLIPHMNSAEGPAMLVADFNNDGKEDIFIGGAKYQKATLFFQKNGSFIESTQNIFSNDYIYEDVVAQAFDFDNDNDNDIIVLAGGNEFDLSSIYLKPRVYVNDGNGNFTKNEQLIQNDITLNGSCIAIYDYNNDGWQDVFLGAQIIPLNYGLTPKSFLLKNINGKYFQNVSDLLPNQGSLGMIKDAIWSDISKNKAKSLIIVGEWMPVISLSYQDNIFKKEVLLDQQGWWQTVKEFDFDNDGDNDLLLGNLGLNSKLKASPNKPVNLYVYDFDNNGKTDPILTYFKYDEQSIFPYKMDLDKHIPILKKEFLSYKTFSEATIQDIFKEKLDKSLKLEANEFRSGILINNKDKFEFSPFSNKLQISVIQDFLLLDINNDNQNEILCGGNMLATSIQEGSYNASKGHILFNQNNQLISANHIDLGFVLEGEIKKIEQIKIGLDTYVVLATNNDSLQWFKIIKNPEFLK